LPRLAQPTRRLLSELLMYLRQLRSDCLGAAEVKQPEARPLGIRAFIGKWQPFICWEEHTRGPENACAYHATKCYAMNETLM
jgi:hypothetical protein